VILTEAGHPGLLRRASQADVRGFVSKDSAPERLIAGLRRVATGEWYVDEALASGFLRAAAMPLPRRELAVPAAAEGALGRRDRGGPAPGGRAARSATSSPR